jgi:prepilin-type N-terminal cleavage/methylation domain-containing protein
MINWKKNVSGTTLIELMVAVFIGSLVVMGAYQAYNYVTKSTARENEKALIQKDIVAVTERLGKDIRMAGNGLPGSGVRLRLHTNKSDSMGIFYNHELTKAKPVANIGYSDLRLFVDNCVGARVGAYICISGVGIDTVYNRITRVGNNPTGVDTIYLEELVGAGTFPVASTMIYYCKGILYLLGTTGTDEGLTVRIDNASIPLGKYIDTLNVMPKSKTGAILLSDFDAIASMDILVGGYIGTGANRNMLSESITIGIRNNQ